MLIVYTKHKHVCHCYNIFNCQTTKVEFIKVLDCNTMFNLYTFSCIPHPDHFKHHCTQLNLIILNLHMHKFLLY